MGTGEELYQNIVDRATDGICIIQDKLLMFANQKLTEMVGYSFEEIKNTSFVDYLDSDEINRVSNKYILLTTEQDANQRYDTVLIHKRGHIVDVEINAGRITYDNKPAILAFVRDISERKQYEKELSESEANYRGLIDNMLEGVYRTRPDGKILGANPALVEMLGYESEKELCRTIKAPDLYVNSKDRNSLTKELEKKNELRNIEFNLRRKDGQEITVMESARIVRDDQNNALYYEGVLTDITERKLVEKALRESKHVLTEAQRITSTGSWSIDIQKQTLTISPLMQEIYELDTNTISMERVFELIHPDDREKTKKNYEKLLKEDFSPLEYRIILGNSEVKYVYSPGASLVRDENGKPIKLIGVTQDLTERKEAERKTHLLSSIAKQSIEGIAFSDLEGNIKFINSAFSEMHGYTPEELMGENLSIFHTPEQIPAVDAANKQIKETGEFIGEIWHTRRDGSVFPALMQNSLLYDNSGNAVGMIGTMLDITDRKNAEDALRESEERYRLLIDNAGNPITLFDREGNILLINNTGAKNLGGTPKDFIGKNMRDILPEKADIYLERNLKVIEFEVGLEIEDQMIFPTGTMWFKSSLQPAKDSNGNTIGVQIISHDITKRKLGEQMLQETAAKLKSGHETLQEKNIALKQILEQIENQRQQYRQQLYADMEQAIAPFLKKLKDKAKLKEIKEFEALEKNLNAILTKDLDDFKRQFARLTARESEICAMIKNGMSSKEISSSLNLSLLTISKHREKIRKKLGLTNNNISLATYLRSHLSNEYT